jgi:Cu(I)/Ag(I) efflux system membrane fusion protein
MKIDLLKSKWFRIGIGASLLLAAYQLGRHNHSGMNHASSTIESSTSTGSEPPSEATLWTCAMHPQIKLPGPGKCPICAMDLIPLDSGDMDTEGLRVIQVSSNAATLMNLQTAHVERKAVSTRIRMVGKVAVDETRISTITAWVPGRIDRLYADFTGVQVKKGDHMVSLYSPDILSAQQELLQAIQTRNTLQSHTSKTFRETAEATVEAARNKLRLWGLTTEQVAEIEARGSASDHMTIYSPSSGIVIDKSANEGMYVQTGTRIYTIADLSTVWVTIDAYESDIQWLRYGQSVTFSLQAYPGDVFQGKISFIQPVLDEKTRTIKVRVSVPNEDGRLKPGMFVSAMATADIGRDGTTIDPSLADKWISPMHPEIIKDGPGECDICGMPLVKASELGYRNTPESKDSYPLVIPSTAPLLTGKRAIVYVKVPDAKTPTYEGREILVGPRVGSYTIVKHGLQEGEEVVVSGNFKLDAELQIQAKPSMMTPGDHHHHRDAVGSSLDKDHVDAMNIITKNAFAAVEFMNNGDLASARSQFRELDKVLREANALSWKEEIRSIWKEYFMLLSNDAHQGMILSSLSESDRLKQMTLNHAGAIKGWLPPDSFHASAKQAPGAFLRQLKHVLSHYITIQTSLAADQYEHANKASRKLDEALKAVQMNLLSHEDHRVWMVLHDDLRSSLDDFLRADDMADARMRFGKLSSAMIKVTDTFPLETPGLYEAFCPMALNDKGGQWLQMGQTVQNPYFGAEMIECGSIKREIK